MDIRYFMKIQNAYGTKNRRDRELVKVNQEFSDHFEDSFDTEKVLLNGKPFSLMIIRSADEPAFKKEIKSRHHDPFNLGDYVEWNGQIWLIASIDPDGKAWNRGYMYLCSALLRWQNEKGELIERYGYIEAFEKHNAGITGGAAVTVGCDRYHITLPADEETKKVKRDRRFPIDLEEVEPPDVYQLTNRKILLADGSAFGRGGILTWTLSFNAFDKNTDKKIRLDNGADVWICDYHAPVSSLPSGGAAVLNAVICGDQILKCGFSHTYTVHFEDKNGNTVAPEQVNFSWNVVSAFPDKFTWIDAGGQIELLVEDEHLIGESFKIQLLIDHTVNSELTVSVSGII